MNRQTAFSNALACFHYLLSMYPDSIIGFSQWCCEFELSMHVNLESYKSSSIVKDLDRIRLAGSSLDVATHMRPSTDVIHVYWHWGD